MDGRSDGHRTGPAPGGWPPGDGRGRAGSRGAGEPLGGPGRASSIRSHHLIVVSGGNSLGPAWARFLSGGRASWDLGLAAAFPLGPGAADQRGQARRDAPSSITCYGGGASTPPGSTTTTRTSGRNRQLLVPRSQAVSAHHDGRRRQAAPVRTRRRRTSPSRGPFWVALDADRGGCRHAGAVTRSARRRRIIERMRRQPKSMTWNFWASRRDRLAALGDVDPATGPSRPEAAAR